MRLRTDEGLWLIPSRGIHTFGLLFPIDVIYLDSDLRVVHLIEGLRPMRIGPLRRRSASVLELPARTIEATGTRVGDSILIRPPAALWEVWANEETRKDWAGERAGLRTYYGSQG